MKTLSANVLHMEAEVPNHKPQPMANSGRAILLLSLITGQQQLFLIITFEICFSFSCSFGRQLQPKPSI